MANNQRRMVYSKIWTSQQFGRLSPMARLLYIGMITLADDDGRLVGEIAYLRGQVFLYDDITSEHMKSLKEEVEKSGLIECYEVGNFQYIQHPQWSKYQKIRRDLYVTSSLPSRNGTVTPSLRIRALSKDKISKDKIIDTSASGAEKQPKKKYTTQGAEVLQAFGEHVDPKNKTYYHNTTQRAACDFLIAQYGLDKVLELVKILPQINQQKLYLRQITTPYELKEGWTKIGNALKQKKDTTSNKQRGYVL